MFNQKEKWLNMYDEDRLWENFQIQNDILKEILEELKAMKQQEKDYWDTWRKAKEAEQN